MEAPALSKPSVADIEALLRKIAEAENATFTEYTHDSFVVSLKLPDGRGQNVKVYIHEKEAGTAIVFMSKILMLNEEYADAVDFREMLEMNSDLDHAKIIIDQDFLEVSATEYARHSTEELIRTVMLEVAQVADKLEERFTGEDIQ